MVLSHPRRVRLTHLVALLCALLIQQASAITYSWNITTSGDWETSTNWAPNGIPTAADDVVITLDGDYTVSVRSNALLNSLTLGGTSGTQILDFLSGITTLGTGASVINNNGHLRLSSSGRLRVDGAVTSTGLVTVDGNVVLYLSGTGSITADDFTCSRGFVRGVNTGDAGNIDVTNSFSLTNTNTGYLCYLEWGLTMNIKNGATVTGDIRLSFYQGVNFYLENGAIYNVNRYDPTHRRGGAESYIHSAGRWNFLLATTWYEFRVVYYHNTGSVMSFVDTVSGLGLNRGGEIRAGNFAPGLSVHGLYVDFHVSTTFEELHLQQGIRFYGAVTVTAKEFTWMRGYLVGDASAANQLVVTGSGRVYEPYNHKHVYDSVGIINRGVMVSTGVTYFLYRDSYFRNEAGANFTTVGSQYLRRDGTAYFENLGTIDGGRLAFPYHGASDVAQRFEYEMRQSGTITSAGYAELSFLYGGTFADPGTHDRISSMRLLYGTFTLAGSWLVDELEFGYQATINAGNNWDVNTWIWDSAYVYGNPTDTITINKKVLVVATGGHQHRIYARQVTNHGVMEVRSSSRIYLYNAMTWTNTATSSVLWYLGYGDGAGVFRGGTVSTFSCAGNVTIDTEDREHVRMDAVFDLSGKLTINHGSLRVMQGGTWTGDWTAASDRVWFNGGTVTFTDGGVYDVNKLWLHRGYIACPGGGCDMRVNEFYWWGGSMTNIRMVSYNVTNIDVKVRSYFTDSTLMIESANATWTGSERIRFTRSKLTTSSNTYMHLRVGDEWAHYVAEYSGTLSASGMYFYGTLNIDLYSMSIAVVRCPMYIYGKVIATRGVLRGYEGGELWLRDNQIDFNGLRIERGTWLFNATHSASPAPLEITSPLYFGPSVTTDILGSFIVDKLLFEGGRLRSLASSGGPYSIQVKQEFIVEGWSNYLEELDIYINGTARHRGGNIYVQRDTLLHIAPNAVWNTTAARVGIYRDGTQPKMLVEGSINVEHFSEDYVTWRLATTFYPSCNVQVHSGAVFRLDYSSELDGNLPTRMALFNGNHQMRRDYNFTYFHAPYSNFYLNGYTLRADYLDWEGGNIRNGGNVIVSKRMRWQMTRTGRLYSGLKVDMESGEFVLTGYQVAYGYNGAEVYIRSGAVLKGDSMYALRHASGTRTKLFNYGTVSLNLAGYWFEQFYIDYEQFSGAVLETRHNTAVSFRVGATFHNGANVSNANIIGYGNTLTFSGDVNVGSLALRDAGVVSGTCNITTRALILRQGTISSDIHVHVTESFIWDQGTFSGNGVVRSDRQTHIMSSRGKTLDSGRTLITRGVVNTTASHNIVLQPGASIENHGDWTIDAASVLDFDYGTGLTTQSFLNTGTLRWYGSPVTRGNMHVNFNNTGRLIVGNSTRVRLRGTSYHSGAVEVRSDAMLTLSLRNHEFSGGVTGVGGIDVESGSLSVIDRALEIFSLRVAADVTLNTGLNWNQIDHLVWEQGTISVSPGVRTVKRTSIVSGGAKTLDGGGLFTLAPDCEGVVSSVEDVAVANGAGIHVDVNATLTFVHNTIFTAVGPNTHFINNGSVVSAQGLIAEVYSNYEKGSTGKDEGLLGFVFFHNPGVTSALPQSSALNAWQGGSGDWNDTLHWTAGHLPTADERCVVNPATAVNIRIPIGTNATCLSLYISDTAARTLQVDGDLFVDPSLGVTKAQALGVFHLGASTTVSGEGQVQVNGYVNWKGGSFTGSALKVTVNTGGVYFSSSTAKTIANGHFHITTGTSHWLEGGDITLSEGALFEMARNATLHVVTSASIVHGSGTAPLFRLYGKAIGYYPGDTASTINVPLRSLPPDASISALAGRMNVAHSDVQLDGAFLYGLNNVVLTGAEVFVFGNHSTSGFIIDTTGSVNVTGNIKACGFYWRQGAVKGPGLLAFSGRGAIIDYSLTHRLDARALDFLGIFSVGADVDLVDAPIVRVHLDGDMTLGPEAQFTLSGTGTPIVQNYGILSVHARPIDTFTFRPDYVSFDGSKTNVYNGELSMQEGVEIRGSGQSDGHPRTRIALRGASGTVHELHGFSAPTLNLITVNNILHCYGAIAIRDISPNEIALWDGATLDVSTYVWVTNRIYGNSRTYINATDLFSAPATSNYYLIGVDVYTSGTALFTGYVIRSQGSSIFNSGHARLGYPAWFTALTRHSMLDRFENTGTFEIDTNHVRTRTSDYYFVNHPGAKLTSAEYSGVLYMYSGGELNGTVSTCSSTEGSALYLTGMQYSIGDASLRCLSMMWGSLIHLAPTQLDTLNVEGVYLQAAPVDLPIRRAEFSGSYFVGVNVTVTEHLMIKRPRTNVFYGSTLTLATGATMDWPEGWFALNSDSVFHIHQGAVANLDLESSRSYNIHTQNHGPEGRVLLDGTLNLTGRERGGFRIQGRFETSATGDLVMSPQYPVFWYGSEVRFGRPIHFKTVTFVGVAAAYLDSTVTMDAFISSGTSNNFGPTFVGTAAEHTIPYAFLTSGHINGNWTVPAGGEHIWAPRGWLSLRNGECINEGSIEIYGGGSMYHQVSRGVDEQSFLLHNKPSGKIYSQIEYSWHIQGNGQNRIRNEGSLRHLGVPGYSLYVRPWLENIGTAEFTMVSDLDSRWRLIDAFLLDAGPVLDGVILDGEGYVRGSATNVKRIHVQNAIVRFDSDASITTEEFMFGSGSTHYGSLTVTSRVFLPYIGYWNSWGTNLTSAKSFIFSGPGRIRAYNDASIINAATSTMHVLYQYIILESLGHGTFHNHGIIRVFPLFAWRSYMRARTYLRTTFINTGQIFTRSNVQLSIDRGLSTIQCPNTGFIDGNIHQGIADQSVMLLDCPRVKSLTARGRIIVGSSNSTSPHDTTTIDSANFYYSVTLMGSGGASNTSMNHTLVLGDSVMTGGTVQFRDLNAINTGHFRWLRGNIMYRHANFTNQAQMTMASQLTLGVPNWHQYLYCDYCRFVNEPSATIDIYGQMQWRTIISHRSYSDSVTNKGIVNYKLVSADQHRYHNYDNAPTVRSYWYLGGWDQQAGGNLTIENGIDVYVSNTQSSGGRSLVLRGQGYDFSRMTIESSVPYYLTESPPAISIPYRFYTKVSDGIRLYVNGDRIISWWGTRDYPYRHNSALVYLTVGQRYEFMVEYRAPTGTYPRSVHVMWSSPCTREPHTIPTSALSVDAAGTTPGLNGTYYDGGLSFQDPGYSRTDPNVDFKWTSDPYPGVTPSYTVRWTGYITAECINAHAFATGETITWQGTTVGQWREYTSWSTGTFPWIDDTVLMAGNYSVSIPRYEGVRKLELGSPVTGGAADFTIPDNTRLTLMGTGSVIRSGATMVIDDGDLVGDGDLQIESGGKLIIRAGRIHLKGGIVVDNGGVIQVEGTLNKYLRETSISNHGLINVTDTGLFVFEAESPFYNHATGIVRYTSYGSGSITRSGKDATSQFHNFGRVEADVVASEVIAFQVSYKGYSGGTLASLGAGQIRIGEDSWFYEGTVVSGNVLFSCDSGDCEHTLHGSQVWDSANIEMNRADFYISANSVWKVNSFTVSGTTSTNNYIRSGGFNTRMEILATGSVVINARVFLTHVDLYNHGEIEIGLTSALRIREHSHFHNYGNVTYLSNGMNYRYYGYVTNHESGRFVMKSAFDFAQSGCSHYYPSVFRNLGTIVLDLPSASQYVTSYCYFENKGTIDVSGNGRFRLAAPDTFWQGGSMGSTDIQLTSGRLWATGSGDTLRPAYISGAPSLYLPPGVTTLHDTAELRGAYVYGPYRDSARLVANGTVSAVSGNTYFRSAFFENYGQLAFSGGSLRVRGSNIINHQTGAMHWTGGSGLYRDTWNGGFINLGQLTWDTASSVTREIGIIFHPYANVTMTPTSGPLKLSSGGVLPAFGDVLPSKTVFTRGEFFIHDSSLTSLHLQGSAIIRPVVPEFTIDTLTVEGGQLNGHDYRIRTLTASSGSHMYIRAGARAYVSQSASKTGTGNLYLYAGELTIQSGATMTMEDSVRLLFGDRRAYLQNYGNLTVTLAPNTPASPTTMEFAVNSAWRFHRGSSFTFAKDAGLLWRVRYDLLIEEPSIDLGSNTDFDGNYIFVHTGNSAQLNNVNIKKGNFYVTGPVHYTSVNWYAGSFLGGPKLHFNCPYGACNLRSDAAVSGTKYIARYGTLINSQSLQYTGDGFGDMRSSHFLNEAGANFRFEQGESCASITNGCMRWYCATSSWCVLANRGNMTWDMPAGRGFTLQSNLYNDGIVNIKGSTTLQGATYTTRNLAGGRFTLEPSDSPTWSGSGAFHMYGGVLDGSGTLDQNIINYHGTLAPSAASSPYGQMTVKGYSQEERGSTIVQVGASNATSLDRIHVTGSLSKFDGRVLTQLQDGISTSRTSFYRVMTTASATTFPGAGSARYTPVQPFRLGECLVPTYDEQNSVVLRCPSHPDVLDLGVPDSLVVREDTVTFLGSFNIIHEPSQSLQQEASLGLFIEVENGVVELATLPGQGEYVQGGPLVPRTSCEETTAFIGGLTIVEAALRNATYTSNPNYNGPEMITLLTTDLGYRIAGGVTTQRRIAVTVLAVNDAPVLVVPADQRVDEDDSVIFSGFEVSDVDVAETPGSNMNFAISCMHGTLTLLNASHPHVTYTMGDGIADKAFSFNFSDPAIVTSQVLPNITYAPDLNYNGNDTCTVIVDDLGNTGLGGPLNATANFTVIVRAVNDAPTIAAAANVTLVEDSTIGIPVTPGDVDIFDISTSTVPFHMNLSVSHGTLSFPSATVGVTVLDNTTQWRYQLRGRLADLVTSLSPVTYIPSTNFNGEDQLELRFSDEANIGIPLGIAMYAHAVVNITVQSINDAPTANLSVSPIQVVENCAYTFPAIQISDVDLVTAASLNVTAMVNHGGLSLTPAAIGSLTFATGDGSADPKVMFTGTLDNVNAALASLRYDPTANYAPDPSMNDDQLTLIVDDQGSSGVGGVLSQTYTVPIDLEPDVGARLLVAGSISPAGVVDAGDALTVTFVIDHNEVSTRGHARNLTWSFNPGSHATVSGAVWTIGASASVTSSVSGVTVQIDELRTSENITVFIPVTVGSTVGYTTPAVNLTSHLNHTLLQCVGVRVEQIDSPVSAVVASAVTITTTATTSDSQTTNARFNGAIADVALGERITIRQRVSLREGLSMISTRLNISRPDLVQYESARVVSLPTGNTVPSVSLADDTGDSVTNLISFNFGLVSNPGDNVVNTGDDIVVDTVVAVVDVLPSGISAGQVFSLHTAVDDSRTVAHDSTSFEIVLPGVKITTSTNVTSVDAEQARSNVASNPVHGSPVLFTVTIENQATATAAAQALNITDSLAPGFVLLEGTVTTTRGSVISGNEASATSVHVLVPVLAVGETAVVTFAGHAAPSILVGSNISTTSMATWASVIPSESESYGNISSISAGHQVYLNIPGPRIASVVADDPDDADRDHSDGDVVTITFSESTNSPAVNTNANLLSWLSFSPSFGADVTGTWTTNSILRLTIVNATTTPVPLIGAATVTVTGSLRNQALTSLVSDWTSPVLGGDWGRLGPQIIAVTADDPDDADSLFSIGDTVRVEFDTATNTPPVATGTQLNNEFDWVTGDLGSDITGAWNTTSILVITVTGVSGVSVTPEIGTFAIKLSPSGALRDINTITIPQYSTSPNITGDWGLLPGPVIASMTSQDPDDSEVAFATGDTVTITFNVPTNQPTVATKSDLDALLSWNAGMGADYTGAWTSTNTLTITIVDPGTDNPNPATTTVTVLSAGNLRSTGGLSLPSTATSSFSSSSDWGRVVPPRLVSVVTSDPDDLEFSYNNEDAMTFTFDSPTNKPAITSSSALTSLFTFRYNSNPVLWGSNLTSAWNAAGTELVVTIHDVTLSSNVPPNAAAIATMSVGLTAGAIVGPVTPVSARTIFDSQVLASGSWGASPAPQIVSARAADPDNADIQFSSGDTLTISFNAATNQPPVSTKSNIDNVFQFSSDLGLNYTGVWVSPTTLVITIEDIGTSGGPVPGSGTVTVRAGGNLKDAAETSLASVATATITGDWGTPPAPVITLARASSPSPGSDAVFSDNDRVTITFSEDTSMPVITTKADVDRVFAFSHAFGADYTGVWVSPTVATITVITANTTGVMPPPFWNSATGEPIANSGLTVTVIGGTVQNANKTSLFSTSVAVVTGDWGTARVSVSSGTLAVPRPQSGAMATITLVFSEACDRLIPLANGDAVFALTWKPSSNLAILQTGETRFNLSSTRSAWTSTSELKISDVPVNSSAGIFSLAILGAVRDEAQVKRPVSLTPNILSVDRPLGPAITNVILSDPDNLDDKLTGQDQVEISFDLPTNAPVVATKAQVDALVNTSYSLGADYSGAWNNDSSTLTITIVDPSAPANTIPRTVANLDVGILVAGGLTDKDLVTAPSNSKSKVTKGNWGDALNAVVTLPPVVTPTLDPDCRTFWCRFWWLLGIAFSLFVLGVLSLIYFYTVRQHNAKVERMQREYLKARIVQVGEKDALTKQTAQLQKKELSIIIPSDPVRAKAPKSAQSQDLQRQASLHPLPALIPNIHDALDRRESQAVLNRNQSIAELSASQSPSDRLLRSSASEFNIKGRPSSAASMSRTASQRSVRRPPSQMSRMSTDSSLLNRSTSNRSRVASGALSPRNRIDSHGSPEQVRRLQTDEDLNDILGPAVAAPPARPTAHVPQVRVKKGLPPRRKTDQRGQPFNRTAKDIEALAPSPSNIIHHKPRQAPVQIPRLHMKRALPTTANINRSSAPHQMPRQASGVLSASQAARNATVTNLLREQSRNSLGVSSTGSSARAPPTLGDQPPATPPSQASPPILAPPPKLQPAARAVIPSRVQAALAAAGAFEQAMVRKGPADTPVLPARPGRAQPRPSRGPDDEDSDVYVV